ncbi:MAG: DNA-binding response regulator [Clostridiales bacterium]|uniref:response regulator transcription factor n=1 Tax=Provencibacterium massiliense TaxID=1841868 RepID=UPI0009A84074|nr:response regulator transcription factor [Provencibacterium massiliense]PWM40548.1 MAG: DNA-binding response regulator [Clostridiales bacterium]RGB67879.1 DNA-binding response regulator [Harryflintia acetispora]
MRILAVEDERDLLDVTAKRLEAQGYSVDRCTDGQEALDYAESAQYDLILLDIMLPKVDGLSVLRRLRGQGNRTPVLLLTARDSIEDRVQGLDGGADDYLTKPFAFEELLARVRVLLRRGTGEAANELALGDLCMDLAAHRVTRAGKEIKLSAKEYAILEYMLLNRGVVLSRERIEEHVWNYDFEGGSNVVDVYMRYLRRKLDDPFEKKLIHTVRGSGYVIREEV